MTWQPKSSLTVETSHWTSSNMDSVPLHSSSRLWDLDFQMKCKMYFHLKRGLWTTEQQSNSVQYAEKAFDRVNWNFLFATLHKFGFGNSFINWLKILYNSPTACVRTNAQTSSSFCLKRGTRQGCPLSPSLFAILLNH